MLIFSIIPTNISNIINAEEPDYSTFGYTAAGTSTVNFALRILGTWGEVNEGNGIADSISFYVKNTNNSQTYVGSVTAGLYTYIDNETEFAGTLLQNGQTEERVITVNPGESRWIQLEFNYPKPLLTNNTKYYCVASADSGSGTLMMGATNNEPGYSFWEIYDPYYPELPAELMDEDYSSFHRSIYCTYTLIEENSPPTILGENPENNATNIELWPQCNATVYDIDEEEEDLLVQFYENTTGTWALQHTYQNVQSGDNVVWTNFSNASEYDVTYWWKVCCYDGVYWTNETYSFTTRPGNFAPVISNEYPGNQSTEIPYNPTLSITATDVDADEMTIIFSTNASGTWTDLGTYIGTDGLYSQPTTVMDQFDTIYYWKAQVYDGQLWTNETYHFLSRPENYPAELSNEYPADGSIDIEYNPELSVTTNDVDSDELTVEFWSNSSGPWTLLGTYQGYNGIYSQETSGMDDSGTIYNWGAHVFDGTVWTNETYSYTSRPNNFVPLISDEKPEHMAGSIGYNPLLRITVIDMDFDALTVIFKSNASGTWEELGLYNGGNGEYIQETTDMDGLNETYYWSIHVTDGQSWVNETYWFSTAETDIPLFKWKESTPSGLTSTGPLIADVNADGRMEIIRSGENGIIALDGATGEEVWYFEMEMWNDHCPLEIIDLNKDEYPEIIFSYEHGTMAIHGNNKTVYWYNPDAPLHNKYPVAGDINADGYPEVYTTTSIGGSITALTHDGHIFAQVYTYYPCFSGLTLGDTDQDGVFELYLNERSDEYHDNGLGKGVRAMWASNLTDRWAHPEILCSSHCPALVDVDKDGKLDVVSLQQSGGGIIVINSTNGDIMRYTKNIPGLGCHSQMSIADIDNDGNLELTASRDSKPIIWDLYDWEPESGGLLDDRGRLPYDCNEPPSFADVTGDGNMDIIAATHNNITIFNNQYEVVGTLKFGLTQAQAMTMSQDVDNDGFNELIFNVGSSVYVYDTITESPTPRALTQYQFYSQHRERSPFFTQYGPEAPVTRDEIPEINGLNYPKNPELSAYCYDYQGDNMNITFRTNASGTWEDLITYTNVSEGRYSATPQHMDEIDTMYWWSINISDNLGHSRNILYYFTTIITKPILNNPIPVDEQEEINITPVLSIDAICFQGPYMDIIFRTNASGTWETIGTNSSVENGTYTCDNTEDINAYFTKYWWSVNSTDLGTGNWTNQTFMFKTEFNDPPVISNEIPSHNTTDVSVYIPTLIFELSDDEDDVMDYSVETSPDIGSYIGVSNGGGIIEIDVSNLDFLTTYTWFVNVTDSFGPGNYTSENYSFTTEATAIDPIIPYERIQSTDITAGGATNLEKVDLYYRWSETNWTDDWTTLIYDDFEGSEFDWGNWVDGGADCRGYDDGEYSYQGQNAINLEDDTSTSYTESAHGLDLETPGYDQIKIDFWANYSSIEDNEYLEIYVDRESVWTYYPLFENRFIHHEIYITNDMVEFDSDAIIRFEAEFSGGGDDVYIDHVYINATTSTDWKRWNDSTNPDINYPWSWYFDFPKKTGYYEFAAMGNKSGMPDETLPDIAEAFCYFTDNTPHIVDENPGDGEVDLLIDLTELSFTLIDYQDDRLDYTISTTPDIINGPISGYDIENDTEIIIPIMQELLAYDTQYTWDIQVTDGTFWKNETFDFITRPAPAEWWDDAWKYRKELQIDHTKVFGNLVDFPVLLRIENDDSLSEHAQENGQDIVFTDIYGTKLNHELELYSSDEGSVTVWVQVPMLLSSSDTILYIYYGNAGASDQQNPEDVWDDDYLAVHHFSETSGNHLDSTIYGNDSVITNIDQQGTDGGIISKCDVFNGIDNYIQFPNKKFAAGKDELTIEMWINPDNDSSEVTLYDEWNATNYWQYTHRFSGFATRDASGGPTESRNNDITLTRDPQLDTWQYITTWYSVSQGEKRIYYNDTINAYTLTGVGNLTNIRNETSPRLGYASDGRNFSGKMDEFRVSRVARSTEWIQTTYHNIVDSSSFFSIGSEELIELEINDVAVKPLIQTEGGFVNISCTVRGSLVDDVRVNITYPDASIQNESMNGDYYFNQAYTMNGTYTFFIFAQDTLGHSIISNTESFEIVEEIPIQHYRIALHKGWNLISLPINVSIYKDNLTINYGITNFTWEQAVNNDTILDFIFEWNSTEQEYNFTDILNAGNGHWIYAEVDCNITLSHEIIEEDNYITDLFEGWNLMGIPFDSLIEKEDIIVLHNEIEYNWDEAADQGIILPLIFTWNSELQIYDISDIFTVGASNWLYAHSNCRLLRVDN